MTQPTLNEAELDEPTDEEPRVPFQCWICGRFARFIRKIDMLGEYGWWITWECKKCGRQTDVA